MTYIVNSNGYAVAQVQNVAVIEVVVDEEILHAYDDKASGALKGSVKFAAGDKYNKLVLTIIAPVINRGVVEVKTKDISIQPYTVKSTGELTPLGHFYNLLGIEFKTDNVDDTILDFDFDNFEAQPSSDDPLIMACTNLSSLKGKRISFKTIKTTATIKEKTITYDDIDYSSLVFVEAKKSK